MTAVPLDIVARFARLALPMPLDTIKWRQDGKPVGRQGKWFARFVAYIDPRDVQRRLDDVFPGDWELHQELLPERADEDGVPEVTMKATITILGLHRSCVGSGSTYKNAASDSFKRAAVRFGIGAELYDYDVNWVQVDGDGKYAKPLEDPAEAYARRSARNAELSVPRPASAPAAAPAASTRTFLAPGDEPVTVPATKPHVPRAAAKAPAKMAPIPCPKCGSKMWDNRDTRKGNQPDYKCTNAIACDKAVWLTDEERAALRNPAMAGAIEAGFPPALVDDDQDDLPF